ncbi:MAG: pyridoxamine 5'-phosphate oxidase family protein [Clostridia bacterium]|nr:pyridoxamine 5'-phosphate oxidase family protein [Clostridia bacterium]
MAASNFASVMTARFGGDKLMALATTDGLTPSVRAVNAHYEDGAFYIITHARSNKMHQITANPAVALCGDWFTGHGRGESLGWVCDPANEALAARLREAFAAWYGNGHVNEDDRDTVILRVTLTDGVVFNHGARYAFEGSLSEGAVGEAD